MTEERTGQPDGQTIRHSLRIKARKERIRDRIIGLIMIAAGIVLSITGIKTGHITMLWSVVGVAGIALFIDSFLERKSARIALNVAIIIALAVVYFSITRFNSAAEPTATEQQTIQSAE
jgi:thiol:disulfide interchange protein